MLGAGHGGLPWEVSLRLLVNELEHTRNWAEAPAHVWLQPPPGAARAVFACLAEMVASP